MMKRRELLKSFVGMLGIPFVGIPHPSSLSSSCCESSGPSVSSSSSCASESPGKFFYSDFTKRYPINVTTRWSTSEQLKGEQ